MNRAYFERKIEAIARILDFKVEFAAEDMDSLSNSATLRRDHDHAELWIRNVREGNKDRFKISGHYPIGESGYRPHDIKAAEISVTTKKTPYQIAREILWRLLPEYLIELDRAISIIEVHDDYTAIRLANLGELAGLAHANLFPDPSTNSGRDPSFRFGGEGNYLHHVKCWGSDKIQMELDNLTMDQAKKVIEILKN